MAWPAQVLQQMNLKHQISLLTYTREVILLSQTTECFPQLEIWIKIANNWPGLQGHVYDKL